MKKIKRDSLRIRGSVYIMFIILTSYAYSVGGIEILTNTTNSSAANPAQQSAVSAEAVFYNPAGSAFLDEGHHFHYGAYVVGTDYETRVGGLKADTDDPQVLPSFSYIYRKNRAGYYLGFGNIGQGGLLEYDISTPTVEEFDATIIHPGGIFGVSYMVREDLSMSLGGRWVYSRIEAEGKTIKGREFESRVDAWGIAPEVGVHARINEKWDVAAKYLGETKLSYDGSLKKGEEGVVDILFGRYSRDHRKNFPAILSLGTSYELNEYQKVSFGYNWIFESEKDVDKDLYGEYDDTFEYSVSFEQYVNEKFDLILGYAYTDKGDNNEGIMEITELDAHQVGTGLRYKYSPQTEINFGVGIIFYKKGRAQVAGQEVISRRRETLFGVGVNTKL